MFAETNWLAVFVAALSAMVIGFIWYNPKVFGTAWMKAAGISPDAPKKANLPLIFSLTFLMALIVSAFIGHRIHNDEVYAPFIHGMYHGLVWSGFLIVPYIVTNALYETKGWNYILINAGYAVVTVCVEAGILFAWG